jgi:hypothetical protein
MTGADTPAFPSLELAKKSELRLSLPNCQRANQWRAVSRHFPMQAHNFTAFSPSVNGFSRKMAGHAQEHALALCSGDSAGSLRDGIGCWIDTAGLPSLTGENASTREYTIAGGPSRDAAESGSLHFLDVRSPGAPPPGTTSRWLALAS